MASGCDTQAAVVHAAHVIRSTSDTPKCLDNFFFAGVALVCSVPTESLRHDGIPRTSAAAHGIVR